MTSTHVTIPHNRLTHGIEEIESVSEVIASGQWAMGEKVAQLEQALARQTGTSFAIAVSSGLSALRLTLKGLGVCPGDEVIIPAYCCVALANSILALGAVPILAEIRESDWNLDVQATRNACTKKTRVIVLVNTFGEPGPVSELRDLNIPLIEDASHGFGLRLNDSVMGGRADASIISFYATKLVAAGEGGAVLTSQENLANIIHKHRDYSSNEPDGTLLNDKMTDVEAALALTQLDRLDTMINARAKLAHNYDRLLGSVANSFGTFTLPTFHCDRVWYRYVLECKSAGIADNLMANLEQRGIHAVQPVADWRNTAYRRVTTPVADRAFERIVSLPLYPDLRQDEQERVCEGLMEFNRSYNGV